MLASLLDRKTLLAAPAVALVLVGTALAGSKSRRPVAVPFDEVDLPAEIRGFDSRLRISAGGEVVAIQAEVSVGNGNTRGQILAFHRKSGETTLLSRNPVTGAAGNGNSYAPAISPDGRFVAFTSYADDLLPPGGPVRDTNGTADIFLHDRDEGVTRLITVGANPDESAESLSYSPVFSPDGRFVAFTSAATDLTTEGPQVTSPSRNRRNVFVYSLEDASIRLVSVNGAGDGDASDVNSNVVFGPSGRYVLFESSEDLGIPGVADTNNRPDVFLRDLVEDRTELISVNAAGNGSGGGDDAYAQPLAVSQDGRLVLFASNQHDLVPTDTNERTDIFLRDRELGTTTLVTASYTGADSANGATWNAGMSSDGRYVAFATSATDLLEAAAPLEGEGSAEVYVLDRKRGRLRLVTKPRRASRQEYPWGPEVDDVQISDNGRAVSFISNRDDIDRRKRDTAYDIFRFDVRRRRLRAQARGAERLSPVPEGYYLDSLRMSANGKYAVVVLEPTDAEYEETPAADDAVIVGRLR